MNQSRKRLYPKENPREVSQLTKDIVNSKTDVKESRQYVVNTVLGFYFNAL